MDDIDVLKGHYTPLSRDESYLKYTEERVRFLKNVGLLDCFFDYETHVDMIFTTDKGKRRVASCERDLRLKDLRDLIVYENGGRDKKRYRAAVKKAIGATD